MHGRVEIRVVSDRSRQVQRRFRRRNEKVARARLCLIGPFRIEAKQPAELGSESRQLLRIERHERIESRVTARVYCRGLREESSGGAGSYVENHVANGDADRLGHTAMAEDAERKILNRKIGRRAVRGFDPASKRSVVCLVHECLKDVERFRFGNRLDEGAGAERRRKSSSRFLKLARRDGKVPPSGTGVIEYEGGSIGFVEDREHVGVIHSRFEERRSKENIEIAVHHSARRVRVVRQRIVATKSMMQSGGRLERNAILAACPHASQNLQRCWNG